MEKLDLLLVNAPSRDEVYGKLAPISAAEPPVWAGLIATYCLQRGFTVRILDAEAENLDAATTALRIIGADPLLTVFCVYGHQPSASTQCMPGAIAVAKYLNSMAPDLEHMVMGTHASALPEETLREGAFDFVIQGEGPITIAEMLLVMQRRKNGWFMDVPGLRYLDDNGAINRSLPAPNLVDLDIALPRQAWHLLDWTKYRAHNWHLWTGKPTGGYASVQTSLGCPFKCSFCCINAPFTVSGDKPQLRKWSPENAVFQILDALDRYGITNFKIPDEMFLLDRRHVSAICDQLIAKNVGQELNIWAYARVDTVGDTTLLAKMRRAGFRWLGIGVESGSDHVRDGVEKGRFDTAAIEEAISRVRATGINVAANYIFGLPDDTEATMRETLDLAIQLNTEWANFYCAMAYPGSQLHHQFSKNKPRALPEAPGGPGWIGYSQHAWASKPLPTATLAYHEVLDFRDQAFMAYFNRVDYMQMIEHKFGRAALAECNRMLDRGMPARKHRGADQP